MGLEGANQPFPASARTRMPTTATGRRLARGLATALAAAALLAGGTVSIASAAQDRDDLLDAAAETRTAAADLAAHREALNTQAADTSAGVQAELDAAVAQAKQVRDEAVTAAEGRLESSKGKVLDEEPR